MVLTAISCSKFPKSKSQSSPNSHTQLQPFDDAFYTALESQTAEITTFPRKFLMIFLCFNHQTTSYFPEGIIHIENFLKNSNFSLKLRCCQYSYGFQNVSNQFRQYWHNAHPFYSLISFKQLYAIPPHNQSLTSNLLYQNAINFVSMCYSSNCERKMIDFRLFLALKFFSLEFLGFFYKSRLFSLLFNHMSQNKMQIRIITLFLKTSIFLNKNNEEIRLLTKRWNPKKQNLIFLMNSSWKYVKKLKFGSKKYIDPTIIDHQFFQYLIKKQ